MSTTFKSGLRKVVDWRENIAPVSSSCELWDCKTSPLFVDSYLSQNEYQSIRTRSTQNQVESVEEKLISHQKRKMELEVRLMPGVENCHVSLPLSLLQTLESSHSDHLLPHFLPLQLRSLSDDRLWHLAWCGSSSSSSAIEVSLFSPFWFDSSFTVILSDFTKIFIVVFILFATSVISSIIFRILY